MANTKNNPELDPMLEENQQPQEQVVSLNVDANEFNIIMAGLQELPHRIVDPILRKLMAQAQIQIQR